MHENAVLHFDLGHLGDDGPFTLRVGAQRYTLRRHTRQTVAEARRNNAALGLLPKVSPSHYAGPVRLPGQAVVLLRVSGPRLRQEEPLDRLVHTAIWVPRQKPGDRARAAPRGGARAKPREMGGPRRRLAGDRR